MDENSQPVNFIMKNMQKKLDQIEKRKKKVLLAVNLQQASAARLVGFFIVAIACGILILFVRIKEKNAMATEKSYQIENFTKYSGTNQQDLENFVSKRQRAFEIKPVT